MYVGPILFLAHLFYCFSKIFLVVCVFDSGAVMNLEQLMRVWRTNEAWRRMNKEKDWQRDQGERGDQGERMVEDIIDSLTKIVKIAFHHRRASQPPEPRPNGKPTTRAKSSWAAWRRLVS